jgi:hypothetical protein
VGVLPLLPTFKEDVSDAYIFLSIQEAIALALKRQINYGKNYLHKSLKVQRPW